MSKPSTYVALPMRGREFFNFPACDAARDALAAAGWAVTSPADLDRVEGYDAMDLTAGDTHNWDKVPANWPSIDAIMQRDLAALGECDAIYLLAGWQDSPGANMELGYARARKLLVFDAKDGVPDATSIDVVPVPVAAEMAGVQVLPADAAARKTYPLYRGLLRYFPDALALVAHHSWVGNEQHHPGDDLWWDKATSADENDALLRHMLEERWVDVAWRALANLQRQVDAGWRPVYETEEG